MDIWGWIVIGVVVVVVLLLKLAKDTWNAEKAIPGCGALLGCLSIPLWLAAAIVFAFLVLVYNATHPTPPPKSAHLPPPTTSMLSQAPTPSQTTGSLVGEWLENDGKRRFVFHSATSGTGQLVEIYTRSGHGWNAWQASVSTAERVDLNGLAWDGNNYWVQNGNDIRTSFAATHLDLPPSYYSVGYTFTIVSNDKLVCKSVDRYVSKYDETGNSTAEALRRQEDPPRATYLIRTGR